MSDKSSRGEDDESTMSDHSGSADEVSNFVQTNPMMERIRSTLYEQLL
eukprot:CAMPEP_0183719990 /NCGR_PEP_ID=MMETSP0737-20130205/12743_1 /TAXON_ID=385413 /ORGANISM="Thalassiosira miniscula, Strain CCMP1093" /LENGTH=47 /DNA_ID= /DNA_START= /DNA_END= /DNA_ORIENTATION=